MYTYIMDAKEIIRRARLRQGEILRELPQELLDEYEKLTAVIRFVRGQLDEDEHEAEEDKLPGTGKVALKDRKEQLVAFLRRHGPASRQAILDGTGIPAGSLGVVLKDDAFEKNDEGLWMIAK